MLVINIICAEGRRKFRDWVSSLGQTSQSPIDRVLHLPPRLKTKGRSSTGCTIALYVNCTLLSFESRPCQSRLCMTIYIYKSSYIEVYLKLWIQEQWAYSRHMKLVAISNLLLNLRVWGALITIDLHSWQTIPILSAICRIKCFWNF